MIRRKAGLALVCLGLGSGCSAWQDEVVIQLRDPSLVSVAPPSRDPHDGAIPPGRAPAIMRVADGSNVEVAHGKAMSMWLVRAPDGSISSFASFYSLHLPGADVAGAQKSLEAVILTSAGELHLSRTDAPSFSLADLRRRPGDIALFPAMVSYRELVKQESESSTSSGVTTITTKSTFTSIGDRVVFATPASNVQHGVLYSRPSRTLGVVCLITGLVFDGLALFVLEKARSAKEAGEISGDTPPIVFGTAGALAAASLPFHIYGGYLLLASEKRTPLP